MLCYRTRDCLLLIALAFSPRLSLAEDHLWQLQTAAIKQGRADFAHWGTTPDNYMQWGTHSNRLIPVYTFGTKGAGEGIDLEGYVNRHSPYRSAMALTRLYGKVPQGTLDDAAVALDQTNLAEIQRYALAAGKKHIILVLFDGMDWQTTLAASIYKTGSVGYQEGRGSGLHFQDYEAGGRTQYGYMVTAPYADDADVDVTLQTARLVEGTPRGGYAMSRGGMFPWSLSAERGYIVGQSENHLAKHPYADSASSGTSMTAGIKTYNAAINVDHEGRQVPTVAHLAQSRGYRIGVVTSVPISHATPACAYAHNVHRDDYQDLSRDLLGLKSISHPEQPLPGVDVLLGAGYGESRPQDNGQGENFVPGNPYLTAQDLFTIDVRQGGKYLVSQRTSGVSGAENLREHADLAIDRDLRLLGFFGVKGGHLPYRTADGDYRPAIGRRREAEVYSEADIRENPTRAEMTEQALRVLSRGGQPFWLMVEAGDVDWANHDNNIDNSIGAVLSGEDAVKTITDWVEQHSNWEETVLIVTADHGHYLELLQPQALIPPTP